MIRLLLKRIGIDRPVGIALFSNAWTGLSGLVTLLLLLRFLSPGQQGFYYAFNNFLNATLLFELGLSYVILQFASHERAKLEWTPAGTLTGDARAKARLAGLFRISLAWYGATALLTLTILLPAGLLFFSRYAPASGPVAWQGAWSMLTCGAAALMLLTPLPALLEGCGLVTEVGLLRTGINIASSLVQWLILLLHGTLYAAAAVSLTGTVGIAAWLWRTKRPFLHDMAAQKPQPGEGLHWREEFWPFQWKVALTSLSYYAIVQALTLVLFAARGPAAAGRLGLSLGLVLTLFNIPQAWLTTKTQRFGTLIAQQRWADLDTLFFPALWRSWVLAALAGGALWGAVVFINFEGYALAVRMLPPLPMGLLIATAVINHGVSAEGLYLRAHKREPFMGLSLTVAALVVLSDTLFASRYGALGILSGYFLITLVVSLGGGTGIFVTSRRRWRSASSVPEA